MSEEHEDVAAVTVDPAQVEEKTDEELLAEMEAEEAAKTEAARVAAEESAKAESARLEAEAKAKADEEARVEAERLAAEEADRAAAVSDSLTVKHPSGNSITLMPDGMIVSSPNAVTIDAPASDPEPVNQINQVDEQQAQSVVETRDVPVHDEDKINLLQLLEGYTDERHSIHVRLYEMIPFLDGAIAKSDELLKHILMSLSDLLR